MRPGLGFLETESGGQAGTDCPFPAAAPRWQVSQGLAVREGKVRGCQGTCESVAAYNSLLKKDFIYLFLERGREGEVRERNIHVWLPLAPTPPPRDLAHNPGMCPDWELNW